MDANDPSKKGGMLAATPDFLRLLSAYSVPEGHFDELRGPDGALRPHWQRFVAHAGRLSPETLTRAHGAAERQLHENGVTYNVYDATDGRSRPWVLDVLPLIVPSAQWEPLAHGLRQRARLLNAVAADLYGPQALLASGDIPAALVHGHPGFLRPCHGATPPGGVFLHVVAFDVARGPDGSWWVLGTRAQAPSGSGYALANRLIVSRLLRSAFRNLRVHMLAPFFRSLQQMLVGSAPTEGETPHVVLLTPGPYNETYFEHAYLSRYLGFTLVEGGDLTVRDDRVFLKTLSGLRRVHAILRRLDDDYCDPLELRADSTLGVPGLLQAWRAGNVLVANAFGVGVLETPALYGFLPALCRRLLGEPLELPSVPTWWAGERPAFEDALGRLDDLVVKPAFPDLREPSRFLADLDPGAQTEWLARVHESPERYVFEQYLPLSHAPVWLRGRLESRAVMLRVTLVSDGAGDYRVLPGGLTRIAGGEHKRVSTQSGSSSKETWVLSDAPIEAFSLLRGQLRADDIVHSERPTSSRAGESLFWLGRYAERTQNGARLLRTTLSRLPDSDAFPPGLYEAFVGAARRNGLVLGEDADYHDAPQRLERDLITGTFDREGAKGLAFNVDQTVRVAGAVRDRLSADNWRLLNRLSQSFLVDADMEPGPAETLEAVDQTIVSLVAVAGLEMSHMTRDDGWRFLGLGRLIERLAFAVATLAAAAASPAARETIMLEWLLDLFDKIITYRSRYMRPPEWLPVMDLLLCDRRNPRSVAFQLEKLQSLVRLLPGGAFSDLSSDVGAAVDLCRGAGAPGDGLISDDQALADFLSTCADLAQRLSDAVTLRYFSHTYESTRATTVFG